MDPRPRPADKGLALVVGGGAAIAAQGSSLSSEAELACALKGFATIFGAGAAIEPHNSSASLLTCEVDFGRGIETVAIKTMVKA